MSMAERLCDTICMIHHGRKVLDGSLAKIRADFPTDRVRVRLPVHESELPRLPGMTDFERHGEFHEFRVEDAEMIQTVLRSLADQVDLEHFEVIRPSLHDIFVRIAKPTEEEMAGDETTAAV